MSMFDDKYMSKARSSNANDGDIEDVNRVGKFIQADEEMRRACDDDSGPFCPSYDYQRVWRGKHDFQEWRESSGDNIRSHRKRR